MLLTLDEIAIKHGTDKATYHPGRAHCYTPYYEKFFEPIRELPLKFLEIGVGGGESMRTWLEYFPNANIFGIDIVSKTNPWNTVHMAPDPRYKFVCGSQSDPTFWKCFAVDYGVDWDVIVDDGGHQSDQIIISFEGMWPHVKSGGLYCIEDLGVAYGEGSVFIPKGWPNHMAFIMDRLNDINLFSNDLESLHFSNELAIMRKA